VWVRDVYSAGGSDLVDIPGVIGVWMLTIATWSFVSRGWIVAPAWVRAMGRNVKSFVRRYDLETGIDFGGGPEYEHRLPPPLVHLAGGLLAAIVVAVLWRDAFPGPVRDGLLAVEPMAYLVYASVLWGCSLTLALMAGLLVAVQANDLLINRRGFQKHLPTWRVLLGTFVISALIAATALLPPWLPMAAVITGAGAGLFVLLGGTSGQIRFLWRTRGEPEIYSMGSAWLLGWGDLSMAGVIALIIVPSSGGAWAGSVGSAPTTVAIGTFTGWCGALALWTWLLVGPVRLVRLARHDPARAVPSALEFTRSRPAEDALTLLSERGFRVVEEGERISHRLRIRLDPDAPRRAVEGVEEAAGEVVWRVHPRDMLNPAVLSELRAADRLMRRRELIMGVRRLLTSAKGRRFRAGSGFWLAPHLWYIPAMSRDTDEDGSMTVGPPYHRMLSAEARQHAHEVFRAVRVDLVFIEDGVPVEGVERVLLQLFDHYDLWGVDPIEDRHIFNIPGTRVLIHAFEFDAPLDEDGYPEPDYQNLARGRVLHIMKDRGGGGDEDPILSLPTERPRMVPVHAL
jgi:hypothetical protein